MNIISWMSRAITHTHTQIKKLGVRVCVGRVQTFHSFLHNIHEHK